ncbi:AGE family epimerase/isomerase [Reyranella sp.]|uniref:AGE family epimerase/isomerase n=1 Tax=Reyranella sp. TaxID=1929291 RepID=UPI00272FBA8D|nr:AGE family epimerase/isomerase [Reyranella sp.]MDP2377429.1 AGE family epimerase/isomerase [Reyranella sp.]
MSLQGRRILDAPMRLMVQARQIYVYALAARRSWHDGAHVLVEQAYASMVRDFCHRDGRDGWAYSVMRDGTVADSTRDLYAHAFVLLAIASYVEVTGKSTALAIADETLAFLDANLVASQGGGYAETWPHRDGHRRQNPHMHLFEALLALWECSQQRRYLERAEELFVLLKSRFFQSGSGALIEYFDDGLRPAVGLDGTIVEPGHHYEWCWLLRRFEKATGRQEANALVNALYAHADRNGFDSEGLVIDEICADGTPKTQSRRLWPMTEAIKCNLVEGVRGRAGCLDKAAVLAGLLARRFLEPALQGTWIDRLDAEGRSSCDFVPASSLYHMIGAIDELRQVALDRVSD